MVAKISDRVAAIAANSTTTGNIDLLGFLYIESIETDKYWDTADITIMRLVGNEWHEVRTALVDPWAATNVARRSSVVLLGAPDAPLVGNSIIKIRSGTPTAPQTQGDRTELHIRLVRL